MTAGKGGSPVLLLSVLLMVTAGQWSELWWVSAVPGRLQPLCHWAGMQWLHGEGVPQGKRDSNGLVRLSEPCSRSRPWAKWWAWVFPVVETSFHITLASKYQENQACLGWKHCTRWLGIFCLNFSARTWERKHSGGRWRQQTPSCCISETATIWEDREKIRDASGFATQRFCLKHFFYWETGGWYVALKKSIKGYQWDGKAVEFLDGTTTGVEHNYTSEKKKKHKQ